MNSKQLESIYKKQEQVGSSNAESVINTIYLSLDLKHLDNQLLNTFQFVLLHYFILIILVLLDTKMNTRCL